METPLLELKGVTKSFGDRKVLCRANLKIYENQITTIIGKSGTGKSVLLKHFVGLLQPDEGTVLFRGVPVRGMRRSEWDKCRSEISYMFQNNALFDSMTVFDNIALPLRQTTNLSRKEIENRVRAKIEQTELVEAAGKYPAELSGGMQKRAALARALVTDPKIVLFDEPTTGQDPIRRNVILSMIAQYKKKFGFTAVLISHDIPDVFLISDRILLLWEGGVAFEGSYEELMRLDHPMVDEFLQSLEGFQDELTGLLSKQTFRLRYDTVFGLGKRDAGVTAILFSVKFDLLAEKLGHKAAVSVLKALGEYINTHLGALGAFSARQGRGKILTMLPHIDRSDADQLVEDFGRGLQEKALTRIKALTQARIGVDACFEIHISAGIVEARSNEAIEEIIERATSVQKVIAQYNCA